MQEEADSYLQLIHWTALGSVRGYQQQIHAASIFRASQSSKPALEAAYIVQNHSTWLITTGFTFRCNITQNLFQK
jgi:hypothetical protein